MSKRNWDVEFRINCREHTDKGDLGEDTMISARLRAKGLSERIRGVHFDIWTNEAAKQTFAVVATYKDGKEVP